MVKKLKEKAPEVIRGKATTMLAFYELGNFVWKEHVLKKRINEQEAWRLLKAFQGALSLMSVLCPDIQEDLPGICELAMRTGLTFYDASYLYVALRNELVFITEDAELAEKARGLGVSVLTVDELIREAGLREGCPCPRSSISRPPSALSGCGTRPWRRRGPSKPPQVGPRGALKNVAQKAMRASLFLTWPVVGSTSKPRASKAWRPITQASPGSANTTVVGATSPPYSTKT